MAEKSFFDIFNLYSRNDTSGGILAKATDIRVKADKQNRFLEISLRLPSIIEKEDLYAIEAELANRMVSEISSRELGEMVMNELRRVDAVAYVRFASVYREFKDVGTFLDELSRFISDAEKGKGEKK